MEPTRQHSVVRHNQQFVISVRAQATLSSMRNPAHSVQGGRRPQSASTHTGLASISYSSISGQTVQGAVVSQPIMTQSHGRPVMDPQCPTRAPPTTMQQTMQKQGHDNAKQPTPLESEIVSVSPVSSQSTSSRQFAYADSSTMAQSTISSRSSLSSESPFVPAETTSIPAHRDIYDFRLKRNANIHRKPTLVVRQLREMSLRNTLSLGLERAKSDEPTPYYPHGVQHQTQPTQPTVANSRMSKAQKRRQRRNKASNHQE